MEQSKIIDTLETYHGPIIDGYKQQRVQVKFLLFVLIPHTYTVSIPQL